MKIGLVGYQGSGKSAVFELLTGVKPDPSKAHTGQLGVATFTDSRFDRLVDFYKPKKIVPTRIELLDTPGLSREAHEGNSQRLAIIREANALVHVVGVFAGADPLREISRFEEDLVLADLQVVTNRIDRLRKDATKPRPDREELQAELDGLGPIAARLSDGKTLQGFELNEIQEKAVKAFSLLTGKKRLVVLNTADSNQGRAAAEELARQNVHVVAAPFGLELELEALAPDERAEFAAEMGLKEPSRQRLLDAIFEITDQITFYTCSEKEVHAWLLNRGGTAFDAAGTIHSDLARGFIRAEIIAVDDLLRLGSGREVKAAGLQHLEGKDYAVKDGDEIVIRFNV